MKKLLVIALCIIMCIAMFAGCGNTASPTPDATEAPGKEQKTKTLLVIGSASVSMGNDSIESKMFAVDGNKVYHTEAEWVYDYGDGIIQTATYHGTTLRVTYDEDNGIITHEYQGNYNRKEIYRYTFDNEERIIKLIVEYTSDNDSYEEIYEYAYHQDNYTVTKTATGGRDEAEEYVFIVPYDEGDTIIEINGSISGHIRVDDDAKIANAVMGSQTFNQKGLFISEYCKDAEENIIYEADHTSVFIVDASEGKQVSTEYNDNGSLIKSTALVVSDYFGNMGDKTEYTYYNFDDNGMPLSMDVTFIDTSETQEMTMTTNLTWVKIPEHMVSGFTRCNASLNAQSNPLFLNPSKRTLYEDYAWIFKSYKKTDIFVPAP